MNQNLLSMTTNEKSQGFLARTAVVWKTAVGSVISWEGARLTGSNHPYLAPLTLILCLQVTIGQSLRFALYRTVGTVLGVVMVGLLAIDIPITAWALGLALLVCTAILKMLKFNDLLIHQAALSILFVLYFENQSTGYAWDRVKDTLVGAAVALIFVIVLVPPNEMNQAKKQLQTLTRDMSDILRRAAAAITLNDFNTTRFDVTETLDGLFTAIEQVQQTANQAKTSIPFNLYANRQQLNRLQVDVHRLQHVFIHYAALMKAIAAEASNLTADLRKSWSQWLERVAEAIEDTLKTNLPGLGDNAAVTKLQGELENLHPESAAYQAQMLIQSLYFEGHFTGEHYFLK